MPTVVNLNGTSGGVTSESRVMCESLVRDMSVSAAMSKGWAFVCADNTVTPSAGNDVFCRIHNNSADPLVITKLVAQCAAAEDISIQYSAAYTSATSHAEKTAVNRSLTPTNLFTTKATFESDVDITGDASAVTNQLDQLRLTTAATKYEIDFSGGHELILPTGYSLLLEAVTGGNAIAYAVYCHFVTDARTDD